MVEGFTFAFMDLIKARLQRAVSGVKPINRKLLIFLMVLMASIVVVINSLTGSSGATQTIEAEESSKSEDGTSGTRSVVDDALIFVHIVGEVKSPGIYELDAGSRVFDAVFAAGGLAKSADQSSINLARLLTDGEQVFIAKIGEAPSGSGVAGSQDSKISLNRANQIDLESLPGVGPALAGRIIDYRDANGGFKSLEDLLNVSGIGEKLFAGFKSGLTL